MKIASWCAAALVLAFTAGCDPLGTCVNETSCVVNQEKSNCLSKKGEFHPEIGHAGAKVCEYGGFSKTTAKDIAFTFEKGGSVTYSKP